MVMVHALMVAGPVIVLQLTRLWGPEVDEARVGNGIYIYMYVCIYIHIVYMYTGLGGWLLKTDLSD